MTQSLTVTLVQNDLLWHQPEQNHEQLGAMIQAAGASDLYVLPETFTTGFLGESAATDEDMNGVTVQWMKSLAAEKGAAIAGSAVICTEQGRRNRFLFVEPGGDVQFYDKHHLFSFAGEHEHFTAGESRAILQYKGWRICPQICYDLRFPVWCRNRNDYDLLLFVANWPSRRVDAWDALLKARAIENQCYVAAVNRTGMDDNGIDYPGHSAVYGAFGEELIAPMEKAGCQTTTLDLDGLQKTREKFPWVADADEFVLS